MLVRKPTNAPGGAERLAMNINPGLTRRAGWWIAIQFSHAADTTIFSQFIGNKHFPFIKNRYISDNYVYLHVDEDRRTRAEELVQGVLEQAQQELGVKRD